MNDGIQLNADGTKYRPNPFGGSGIRLNADGTKYRPILHAFAKHLSKTTKEETIVNNPSKQTFEEWSEENAMDDTRTLEEITEHWFTEILEEDFTAEGIKQFFIILENMETSQKGYDDAEKAIQVALGKMDEGDSHYIMRAYVEALGLAEEDYYDEEAQE